MFWMKFLIWFSATFITIIITMVNSATGDSNSPDLKKASQFAILINKAKNEGSIQVLVQLQAPDIEELKEKAAKSKDREIAAQLDQQITKRIKAHVDSFLKHLQGMSYQVIHTYPFQPLLLMKCSPEALTKISSLPEVESLQEDQLKLPSPLIKNRSE